MHTLYVITHIIVLFHNKKNTLYCCCSLQELFISNIYKLFKVKLQTFKLNNFESMSNVLYVYI